ncbi:MAG: MBL fold metallo-hydrolase [Ruminococcaceae bacterium]|nr:MBL fold metallo-hydrolase [Oscillospiraceae bacterium]
MAKDTAKKQPSGKSVKTEKSEETVKKSPKKTEEKSDRSIKKEEKTPSKSEVKTEQVKKSNKNEIKTEETKKSDKSDKKETKEESISSSKGDYKGRKQTQEKKDSSTKSRKDNGTKNINETSKKKSKEIDNSEYTPYKKKAKISLKGFLISFLIIALFLTLNQFLFHIPGVPTWESVFAEEIPDFSIPTGEVQVHFIDVGQGDSTLIVTEEKIVLIDSGETEYDGVVKEYIKNLGITKIDIVIGTHPHSDHIGSMSKVVDGVDVSEIILPKMTKDMIPATKCYNDLLESADKKEAKVRFVRAGERLKLSEGCIIDILAPVSDYDDLNNYSITCKLVHGENSFLFTGDIETSAEYDIVESGADLSVDVLKVPHHGSATSSSYKFLKEVRPTYAVFHVGSPNDYGHPNENIYDRYKEFGCKRYRTDVNGNIVFKSDGTKLSIETENKNGHV